MDTRILQRVAEEIDAALRNAPSPGRPPGFVVTGIDRPARERLLLRLDDLGEPAARRRLTIDLQTTHPTLHWSMDRSETTPSASGGFAERLLGCRLLGLEMGGEPRIRRFRFRERKTARGDGGAEPGAGRALEGTVSDGDRISPAQPRHWVLIAEWTGRAGNLRLIDEDEEVRETALPGGPGPGDRYRPPNPDRRIPCDAAEAATVAARFAHVAHHLWPQEILRRCRDVPPEVAVDAVLRTLKELPPLDAMNPEARSATAARACLQILSAHAAEPPGGPTLYLFPRTVEGGSSQDGPGPTGGAEAASASPPGGLTAEEFGLLLTMLPAAAVSDRDLKALSTFRSPAGSHLMDLMSKAHQANLARQEDEARRKEQVQEVRAQTRRLLRLRQRLVEESGGATGGPFLRKAAEAILSHLHMIRRGQTEAVVPDLTGGEKAPPLRIPLDPAKGPSENAQAYFKRARRLERGEPYRRKRLSKIDEAVAALAVIETRLAASETSPRPGVFARWIDESLGSLGRGRLGRSAPRSEGDNRDGDWGDDRRASGAAADRGREAGTARREGRSRTPGTARQQTGSRQGARGAAAGPGPRRAHREPPAWRPREFRTSEGWKVLVGRSNEENDYLTHRIAHQEDTWLHAHGVPGSHVVLRREGRKDNPSARTLQEAAAIAAWFSKARHSSKTPVIYTLKKYVRKPRKGRPGLALCTREKTIMVVPKDPTAGQEPEWMED